MPRQLGDPVDPQQAAASVDDDPRELAEWLGRLAQLIGVPFNYLVADESMLPPESIRFFQVDPNWVAALLDGAFSLGFAGVAQQTSAAARPRLMRSADLRSRALRASVVGDAAPVADDQPLPLSGCLLRSFVVAAWPGLEVSGYADAAGQQPLSLVRMERVGASVVLCLFSGTLACVKLREPAEGLRSIVPATPRPLRGDGSRRVVSMSALAGALTATTPSQFALKLCAGPALVEFVAGGGG